MVLVVSKTPQLKMQSEVMMSMSMVPKVPQPRQLPPLTGMPHLRTHRALMVLYSVYLLLSKVHFTDLSKGQQYFTVIQIVGPDRAF